MNFNEVTDTKIAAYEAFAERYAVENPVPERPNQFATNLSLLDKLKLVTTMASVLLAATRTAEQFYIAASMGSGSLLGYVEAALAVAAIEGGLVVFSADRARKKKLSNAKKQDFVEEEPRFFDSTMVAILMMLVISIVAGVGQGVRIIPNAQVLTTSVAYIIAFSLGALASIIALLGGHVVGEALADMSIDYERSIQEYEQDVDEYRSGMDRVWKRSPEYRAVKDLAAGLGVQSGVQFSVQSGVNGRQKLDTALDTLDTIYNQTGEIPSVRQLAEISGVARGTAHTAKQTWLEHNGLEDPNGD